jgi:hypothetical protein
MEHLYILRSGAPLPIVLIVPPSSLKAWQEFLSKSVVLRGKRLNQILTKITLKKEQNADGIACSRYVLAKVDNLSPAEVEYVKPMAESLKELCRETQTPIYFETAESETVNDSENPFIESDSTFPG